MNAAEEHAVLALAQSRTPRDRVGALRQLTRGKGIRMSEAARRELSAQALEKAVPIANTAIPHAEPLAPGPEPVLTASNNRALRDWSKMWLSHESFPDDIKPGPLLLHGPTGTGKTMASRWLSALLADRFPAHVVDVHSVMDSFLGGTGSKLSKIFKTIEQTPCLLVVEELTSRYLSCAPATCLRPPLWHVGHTRPMSVEPQLARSRKRGC